MFGAVKRDIILLPVHRLPLLINTSDSIWIPQTQIQGKQSYHIGQLIIRQLLEPGIKCIVTLQHLPDAGGNDENQGSRK